MMTSGAREGTFGVVTRWSKSKQKWSVTLDDGLKIRCLETAFEVAKLREEKRTIKNCRKDFDPLIGLVKNLPFEYPKSAIQQSRKREHLNLKLMGQADENEDIHLVVGESMTIFDVGKVARRMNRTGYLKFPAVDGLTSDEVKLLAGEQS